MFFWISLCPRSWQKQPVRTTDNDLRSYLSLISVATELFQYAYTTVYKLTHPTSGSLHPWDLFIKAFRNNQTPIYTHVFNVTYTHYIFRAFLSCSMRSRMAEFHNLQPISFICFRNKLMCFSFFSFQLNKTFYCANSQQTTIWHFPDDAGIRTEDLREKKKSSKTRGWNFANRSWTHTETT